MRLINTTTLEIELFPGGEIPKYAILSHTWSDEEVTFEHWRNRDEASKLKGFSKIVSACELAKHDGYEYIWVDTNCIDKSSSAELTEAINSMFEWYTLAGVCYAYLSDVETFKPLTGAEEVKRSRWMRRGWTLQELLAPGEVIFYAADWSRIGTRVSLARHISRATGIATRYLAPYMSRQEADERVPSWLFNRYSRVHEASIAERMAWLARRETTRVEDMAYCVLGIFGIHMPLVYGEGTRAFQRLQEEILRASDDHSLFCWSWAAAETQGSMLSPRPQGFLDSAQYNPIEGVNRPLPYSMTNAGLSISLPLISCWSFYIGILNVKTTSSGERLAGIALSGDPDTARFVRRNYPDVPIPTAMSLHWLSAPTTDIFIQTFNTGYRRPLGSATDQPEVQCRVGLLVTFEPRDDFLSFETMPPGRFSADESILQLCPSHTDRNTRPTHDWDPDLLREDGTELLGATIFHCRMRFRQDKTILFVVSPFRKGAGVYPRWHYCDLNYLLADPFKTSPLSYLKHLDMVVRGQLYSEELKMGVRGKAKSALHLRAEMRATIKKAIDDPEFAGSVNREIGKIDVAVEMAPEAFSTTAATILKHVHLALPRKENSYSIDR